jgi:hypothetical protein
MPIPGADASTSSFLLAKCGSTLFCFGRSALLWVVVFVFLLLGVLRNRLFGPRRAFTEEKKKP